MDWIYSWYKIYLMVVKSAFFFFECEFKNNNNVCGLLPPPIQNKIAFLYPMRKMYILRISDYLLQLIVECQCEKWHNYLLM